MANYVYRLTKVGSWVVINALWYKPCENIDLLVQQQIGEVDRNIADIARLREELAQMLRSCEGESINECGIVESLGRRGCDRSQAVLGA